MGDRNLENWVSDRLYALLGDMLGVCYTDYRRDSEKREKYTSIASTNWNGNRRTRLFVQDTHRVQLWALCWH